MSEIPLRELQEHAESWLADALELDADNRSSDLPQSFEARRRALEDRAFANWSHLTDARQALAMGELEICKGTAAALVEENGLDLDEVQLKRLQRELLEYRILYFEILEARDKGDIRRERELRSGFGAIQAIPPQKAERDPLMSELFASFLKDRQKTKKIAPKTEFEYQTTLNLFIEVCGDLGGQQLVDREEFFKFRDALEGFPANHKKKKAYRELSVREILQLEVPESDRLSSRTVEKYLQRVSSVLKWAVRRNLVAVNNAEGIAPVPDRSKVRPFTSAEIATLFEAENMLGQTRQYYFWLPLLGLYTGCRIAELVQLRVGDVITEDGVIALNVYEDSEAGRQLKTAASTRKVPVHDALLELGFLSLIEGRLSESWLLEDIAGKDSKARGASASKWFKRYRDSVGVRGREVNFHSFRRTVITALNSTDHKKLHIQEIVGHERDNVTEDTYHYGSPLPKLKEIVSVLAYPIDLPRLQVWRETRRG